MKTLIFISGLLFVLSSFASESAMGLKSSQIQGFSGSYEQDQGTATASVWNLPDTSPQRNVSFEVYKESTQFRLLTGSEEYLFENAPQFLIDLEEVRWQNLSAETGGTRVSLGLASIRGKGQGQNLSLDQVSGNCTGSGTENDFIKALIQSCSSNGNLRFQKLMTSSSFRGQGNGLIQFFEAILNANSRRTRGSSVTLEDFDLKIKNKNFNLRVKARLDISATIKANGSFEYGQDRVRIRIDKVKASFLTITGKVFDELEKLQDQNIVVSRPYVTISFP
ncbi:MAG: hypothetical protein NXH75_00700 [Halobacteriovoraceae bacterium]|jgi:hypothetical protein|nr:hypothetical protein [Halobacteriovoraceae bacterium]